MIRVFEAFAGYGSQSMALERLKQDYPQFDYEVVGISEIDKYAVKAYNATHKPTTNYGDICLIDWDSVPDFDLFTYSFPCQDISSAGKQKGLEAGSGTRSSLLWECKKAIEAKWPKYLLMENVKALVSKKFISHFNDWLLYLESLGYSNFWKVLNAKDYGVPQNRERVFVVSILGGGTFCFPKQLNNYPMLNDIVENNVDKSYFLSEKSIKCIFSNGGCNNEYKGATGVQNGGKVASCLTANYYKTPRNEIYIIQNGRGYVKTKEFELSPTVTRHGFERNNFAFVSYTRDRKGNVVDRHLRDVANTVHTSTGSRGNTDCFVYDGNIRSLTPRECFRLMGVSETDIDKIQSEGISNSQQYKMAGNSIVVDVLYYIFKNLFIEKPSKRYLQLKLF